MVVSRVMCRFFLVLGIAAMSSAALGDATTCKSGNNIRKVELQTGTSTDAKGCAVAYIKETEAPGATQILWQAKNDQDYCTTKAKAFVEKLQGMGWTCDGSLSSSETAPTATQESAAPANNDQAPANK